MNKKALEILEYGFAILGLILYSGAIFTLFLSGGYNEGAAEELQVESGLIKQAYFVSYSITIGLLGYRWQKTLYVLSKNIHLVLFTVLAIISVIWSAAPMFTINRGIAIFGTNLFGMYLASRYTLKEQLLLLARVCGIILVLSVLVAVLLPKYGIMGGLHAGAWRGVYVHKNTLGRWMVISSVIFLVKSIERHRSKFLTYFGLILSIALLIMSKSSSAIANLLIVVIAFLVFITWRWRFELMIPASLAIMLVGSSFFIWFNENSSVLFSSVGKDATLTGRADLWPIAWDMVLRKPWLGYGFGAFWEKPNGAALEAWRAIGWDAPNAHNGFLDLCLSLGFLGFIIIIVSFLITFIKGFINLRYTNTPYEFWPLIFLTYLTLSNLSETGIMIQNEIVTVIYVMISFSTIIDNDPQIKQLVYSHNG